MARFLWICLGGAIGTGARYLISGWVQAGFGTAFPYGTLAVDVTGSFLLGVVMRVGLTSGLLSPTRRVLLPAGVLGGFTTYSTFNYETLEYLRAGAHGLGLANALTTVGGCLIAGVVGVTTAEWWLGR